MSLLRAHPRIDRPAPPASNGHRHPGAPRYRRPPLAGTAAVALILAFSADGAGAVQEADFTGTYRLDHRGTLLTLVLQAEESGAVRGRLYGAGVDVALLGVQAADRQGDVVVEGRVAAPAGPGGRFRFSPVPEGDFGFVLIPGPARAGPGAAEGEFYAAVRLSRRVAESVLPPAVGAAPNRRGDPHGGVTLPLVGIWSTRVEAGPGGEEPDADSIPPGDVVREYVMELRADGVLLDMGSRVVAPWAEAGLAGAGDPVAWRARGGMLEVSMDGSPWAPLARYTLEASGDLVLIFPADGSRQVWSRVR